MPHMNVEEFLVHKLVVSNHQFMAGYATDFWSLVLNWILLHHQSTHLCWVIQPGTNSQINHLSGLYTTGPGNLILLDCIIITHCWVFYYIFVVFTFQTKGGLNFNSFPHPLTNFQLLNFSGLSCGCDNILVFMSNLFLSVNLDCIIVIYCWVFTVSS